MFYEGPFMFIVTCFFAQPDCRNVLPEYCNIIIKQQLCGEKLPSLLVLLQIDVFQEKQSILQQIHLCPSNEPGKACIRPCETYNSTQSFTIMYHHTASKTKLDTNLSKSVFSIWLYSFFHLSAMSGSSVFFIFFPWRFTS